MIRLALLGHPVAHSRSPAMMHAALRAMKLRGAYVPFDVPPARLGDAVRGLAALGFDGANVTVPHKVAVMEHLVRADSAARLVGAVNTLAREGDGYAGFNTDVGAVTDALRGGGFEPKGKAAVVLGGGGAARAAAVGLALGGASSVTVVARDVRQAVAVAEAAHRASRCGTGAHALGTSGVAQALERAAAVVQATSCGMRGGPASDELLAGADLTRCRPGTVAMDLVYAPAVTPWMQAAERARLRVLAGAGLEMLALQGAAALARWSGREPPVDVMRAALTG